MNLSIIIPLLNEQESLPELHQWIVKVMTTHNYTYEVIFIDDGSTDNSWQIIADLSKNNPNVKGIRFLRNFGKSQALHAGFAKANGDVVITYGIIITPITSPADKALKVPILGNTVCNIGVTNIRAKNPYITVGIAARISSIGFNINRDALYKILRSDKYQMHTIYDPCTYPAVKSKYYFCNNIGFDTTLQRGIVQPDDINMKSKDLLKSDRYTKVSFMVFRTGSCLIVGNCTGPILYFVYNFVKQLLLDERGKIYVPPTAEEPVNKKIKATKPRSRKVQVTSPYFSSLKKVDV